MMSRRAANCRRDIHNLAFQIFDIAVELGISNVPLISFAESCTGGLAAASLCSVPGISSLFPGAVVTYSNRAKIEMLGVKQDTLARYGAVSAQCATEMAYGAARLFDTEYAVSITGIAGPGGGSSDKPVGTVWFALFSHGSVIRVKRGLYVDRPRDLVRFSAVRGALSLLFDEMKKLKN